MTEKRKICVVTGTRAEYGLFIPLLKKLKASRKYELQIVAMGMHLSPEFGLTYREIEKDGFRISEKVEMLLSSDSEVGVTKATGLGMIEMAGAFNRLEPDLVFLLGDRFELLAAATAAMIARIPIAHIHGGELTEGAIDEPIRHSITKMSYLHFTSTAQYRQRVIQLGEEPERVFNVGALGIDNIKGMKLLSRSAMLKKLGFKSSDKYVVVTFHSVTLEGSAGTRHFVSLLKVLAGLRGTKVVLTMPNADSHGRELIGLVDEFAAKNRGRARVYTSMGQLLYLSAMKHADAVVGNSSSGIIETPSFGIPTVNIGDRQRGRVKADTIIDCEPTVTAIAKAIGKALSRGFQDVCHNADNPYGNGGSASRIMKVLARGEFHRGATKKKFYDLNAGDII
jgi:GDP/UDP-N,N'-diacetylbacillosamine 2-epimerase (hydrolysing)